MTTGIQRRRGERGAALLTTMVAVAVLTAVAVDLAYSSRVSLQIAANARDELRATYAARSAVTMGRLVLYFQQQLDGVTPQSGAGAGALAGGAAGAAGAATGASGGLAGLVGALGGAGGLAGALGGLPRVQLWNLIPVDSSLVAGLFPGGPVASPPAATAASSSAPRALPSGTGALTVPVAAGAARPGSSAAGAARPATAAAPTPAPAAPALPPGSASFEARLEDEAQKVNAQLRGSTMSADLRVWQAAQAIYQLVCDSRWDPLFEREDARGVRTSREDLLVRLRDWVNDDQGGRASSALAISGGAGGPCSSVIGQPPFVTAYGDKNEPYDRGDDRYKAKSARMDSLDELYLVAGVGDAFMAAFGDALTVYLPQDTPRNVNVLDKQSLVALARVMAANPAAQPIFLDPTFADRLQQAVFERTLGGMLSITPTDFAQMLQVAGVQVNSALLAAGSNPVFTDRSTSFRIRATGKAGAVETTIDAVVWLDRPQPGTPVAAPGRLVHWREE